MNRMLMITGTTLAIGICLLLTACVPQVEEPEAPAVTQSELEGVWERVEASGSNAEGDWTAANIQPSLFIFHDGYYSLTLVAGDEARPLMADDATRESITDEEVRSIFLPYNSNAGTYEVSGSTFTTKPVVALWPNYMEGGSTTYTYSVEQDMLTLSWETERGATFESRSRRLR